MMTDQSSETGLEVVLDNRKLIIAFALLIAICGCFFVVGFIEGKRQGYQEGAQFAAESATRTVAETLQPPSAQTSEPVTVAETGKEEDARETKLDWYESVNRPDGAPDATRKIMPPSTRVPADRKEPVTTAAPKPKTKPKVEAAQPAASSGYTVQVGAFRQKTEAEIKARQLKAKGFDSRIEPPESPNELYLIKVGRFKTRADAVAMQLRLKKSGFTSFIKAN